MNEIQTFNFENEKVRTLFINEEPYFVGKDVAEILGYSNSRDALSKHVDEEDKNTVAIHDGITRGNPNQVVINESGLYSLILSSKLPKAKKFKHWVTSEVLPTIRQHGAYMTNQKAFDVTNRNGLAELLQQAADQLRDKDKQITEMKPKAIFADAVSTSTTTILIGQLAKILRGNGVNIGQNRLFAWLRENGYLIKKRGRLWNTPTQWAIDKGLFKVRERTSGNPDGSVRTTLTTMVTGEGQQYFINKLLSIEQLAII